MKFCYLLLVHHKVYQLKWLLSGIHNDQDYFIIHVDARAPEAVYRNIISCLPRNGNVRLLPRLSCEWGSFALCRALLLGISSGLKWFPDWSYLINVSGQCFPLKKREERIEDLSLNTALNYVEVNRFSELSESMQLTLEYRLNKYHITFGGRVRNTRIPRRRPRNLAIQYHGSDWFMVTRRFCSWIVEEANLEPLLSALRFALLPSEFIMQYLVTESEFLDTVAPHYLREIVWQPESAHPELLTIRRKDLLFDSPAHFARKFDAGVDEEVLHMLAARVGAAPPRAT